MTRDADFEKSLNLNLCNAVKTAENLKQFPDIVDCIIKSFQDSSFRRGKIVANNLNFATSIELFHNAALIHDDIIDKAQIRRFQKSVPASIGEEKALLTANILYSIAFQIFKKEVNALANANRFSDENAKKITEFYLWVFQQVQVGQLKDIKLEKERLVLDNYEKIETDIYDIIFKKTTTYTFILPEALAHFAENGTMISKQVYKEASEKGFSFQIKDDWENVFLETDKTGKEQMSDIYSKKKTVLLIQTLKTARSKDAQKIIALYNSSNEISSADAQFIKNCMKELETA
ncbi:MAG: polyprenyl synthetase family protein [Bifidobacteriaceae bacterium]|jgi:geranylgeranyl diphosphate synthase type II|nr:polyprenyl synthetase family protein [Bifidobacteriaceae bacterium]